MHRPQAHSSCNPLVLCFPVFVLGRAQRVGHTFSRIHKGAGRVVGGVHLVLGPRPVVGHIHVAAPRHRVAQGLVGMLHVNLEADAAQPPRLVAGNHVSPPRQVLLHTRVTLGRRDAVHALLPHQLYGGVVDVTLASLEQLHRLGQQGVEVVGAVGDHVRHDAERRHIRHDGLHIVVLLFRRVGVVKPQNQTPLESPGEVIVQQRRLGVSDVEEAAGLGREAGHDSPLYRVHQPNLKAPS